MRDARRREADRGPGALVAAEEALATQGANGISFESVKEAFLVAVEAALALGDIVKADGLLASVENLPRGRRPQFIKPTSRGSEPGSGRSTPRICSSARSALFREMALPFHLGATELKHAEWLASQGRGEDAQVALAEPHETFERLEATPWIERVDAVRPSGRAEVPA